ncbi:hypothetical protein CPC08DRAFT_243285 [Agrocybe pediades]|nr:hypothetical protein CPC08DRAFT_243285 [Agrocybe pediades]
MSVWGMSTSNTVIGLSGRHLHSMCSQSIVGIAHSDVFEKEKGKKKRKKKRREIETKRKKETELKKIKELYGDDTVDSVHTVTASNIRQRRTPCLSMYVHIKTKREDVRKKRQNRA